MSEVFSMKEATTIPPPVFSKRFQAIARWVVVCVLWLIISSIAIGKAGIANFMQLMNERDILIQNNMQLKIENQMLEERIFLLHTSPEYQARYLKQNFGYVEQNEYVYQFKK
ncbi:MAG: septum formation initiator family protein [Bdellovibrionota bacterium]